MSEQIKRYKERIFELEYKKSLYSLRIEKIESELSKLNQKLKEAEKLAINGEVITESFSVLEAKNALKKPKKASL